MAKTWHSFWKGWGTAAALWPVVLLLYLLDGALALILAIPPAAQVSQVFGRSTMASDLLGPMNPNLLMELGSGAEGASVAWPLYLLVPLLFLLVATFLRGGTLAALSEGPGSFRWTRFFSDCVRFFPRLLALLPFFVPGLIAVGLIFLAANLVLGLVGFSGIAEAAIGAGLLAILLLLLLMGMDFARISLVLEPERSVWRHVGRGVRFVVRRPPQVLVLGLAFALAGALFAALYPALLQISPFFGLLLPALVLQQLGMLLLTWQRVAMLGGQMALYRGLNIGRAPT